MRRTVRAADRRSSPPILTLVVAVVGFIATLILNAFVLDEYDAYGEVSIPGSTSLHLPAGEVTVSFHTMVTGSPTSGFPIPDLKFSITPPAGVPKPQVTESVGGTTTVNSDTHVQVWVVQIPEEGTYDIVTDGNVNGYISPRLAFGHGSSYGWLTWVFGGLLALGVVELVAALFWSARSAKAASHSRRREIVRASTNRRGVAAPPQRRATRRAIRACASSSSGSLSRCGIRAR